MIVTLTGLINRILVIIPGLSVTTIFRRLLFRPTPEPSAAVPLGARSVGHYRISPQSPEPPRHRDFVQVFWGIKGRGLLYINKIEHILHPGQIAIYFPDMTHEVRALDDYWEYRWWTMDGPLAMAVTNTFGLTQADVYKVGPAPVGLFKKLEDAIRDITPNGERQASTLAYQLLAHAANQPAAPHGVRQIHKAITTIQRRWNDPDFGVEILARELHMHRSLLSRLFHQATGVTPSNYINNLRIQNALSQLKQTDHPISQIAQNCGFADPNYFARAIRKQTGQSPSQFRRQ